jgi:hypothetical protein
MLFWTLLCVYFYFREVSDKLFNAIFTSRNVYYTKNSMWVMWLSERLTTYSAANLARKAEQKDGLIHIKTLKRSRLLLAVYTLVAAGNIVCILCEQKTPDSSALVLWLPESNWRESLKTPIITSTRNQPLHTHLLRSVYNTHDFLPTQHNNPYTRILHRAYYAYADSRNSGRIADLLLIQTETLIPH